MEPLRVLELYSGIGGMHHALRESHIPAHVVAAIDVNTVANEVYKHNFPHTHLLAKTIEGISLEEFDKLSFNMILMSPPCQPFTRIGLQGDMTDPRTNSFLYILDILPSLVMQMLPVLVNAATMSTWQPVAEWQALELCCAKSPRKSHSEKSLFQCKLFQIYHALGKMNKIGFKIHLKNLENYLNLHFSQVVILFLLLCNEIFVFMSVSVFRLQKLPKYILLENVKGFEVSSTRGLLIQTIEACGFQHQEFLLSPSSLGIPNSRLRYFLIAKLQSEPLPFQAPGQILMEFPKIATLQPQSSAVLAENTLRVKRPEPSTCFGSSSTQHPGKDSILFKLETAEEIDRKHQQDNDLSVQMLKDFLEDENTNQYFLPPKLLLRYALLLDIVKPTSRRSMCFTKGYGSYIEGTGSVLQTAEDVQIENVFKSLNDLPPEEKIAKLSTLKLRYFTPREIANLQGFPPEFGFPEKITVKQRYRLLGNSLNVHVVAKLITILCE